MDQSSSLDDFMNDFWTGTQPHPWARGIRIWEECMMIEVNASFGNAHISSIMSLTQKNAGNASRCLKWLCSLADERGVTIDLSVKPIQNAGAREGRDLNKKQLAAWYKRYKFVPLGGDRMERHPNN